MISIVHKECNGPAIEIDLLVTNGACSLPVYSFPFPCFTCLEEIEEASCLRFSEEIPM